MLQLRRGKVFDAEYYRQDKVKALLDEHKKATGAYYPCIICTVSVPLRFLMGSQSYRYARAAGDEKLPQGGYPDMGNGRYSDLLSYDKWLLFNNAQVRAVRHMHVCAAYIHTRREDRAPRALRSDISHTLNHISLYIRPAACTPELCRGCCQRPDRPHHLRLDVEPQIRRYPRRRIHPGQGGE